MVDKRLVPRFYDFSNRNSADARSVEVLVLKIPAESRGEEVFELYSWYLTSSPLNEED
jgi:hypothetical protein